MKFYELNFLGNVIDFNKMFQQLTNMTCSAFPFKRASAHISVPQILAGATIAASTSVTVTVFQVTSFPFPSITTCTQEISYAICAAPIVPTWVGGAFILICKITSIAIEIQIVLPCYEMLTQNWLLSFCTVGSVLITMWNLYQNSFNISHCHPVSEIHITYGPSSVFKWLVIIMNEMT